MEKECIINLERYRTESGSTKSRVFIGRDRGKYVRDKSNIDKLFEENDKLVIIIPDDIYSITPSFLEELLFKIVRKYGRTEFEKKFTTRGKYDLSSSLDEAIGRILQDKTGIDK